MSKCTKVSKKCTHIHAYNYIHVHVPLEFYTFSFLDAGALFSGADIVQWMVENVDGVETEADAQALGQLLLEKGALVHTEGSRQAQLYRITTTSVYAL